MFGVKDGNAVAKQVAKEIYQAAKNGGVTPEGNPSLKRLIEKAKKDQVPADVIKRAIDKVSSGTGENYETLTYEIFGPAGSTLMVECLTDNVNRSNAFTVDWQGNAWYSGDVYVGSTSGTNKDAGSKKLITIDDVPLATNSSPGLVRANTGYGTQVTGSDGTLCGVSRTLEQYNGTSNALLISKGTFENVLPTKVKEKLTSTTDPDWTAAEKKAAKQRLGADVGREWTLLYTVTEPGKLSVSLDGYDEILIVGNATGTENAGISMNNGAAFISNAFIDGFRSVMAVIEKVSLPNEVDGYRFTSARYGTNAVYMNSGLTVYDRLSTPFSSISTLNFPDTLTEVSYKIYGR